MHDDLVATFNVEAISSASVKRHLQEARLAASNPGTTFAELNIELDDCDEAMLLTLNEKSFTSIRQLARLTHFPRTPIHRGLTQSLGFQVRDLR
jgi:hypothetical protein